QPDCFGFYTDTWMRSYGIQLVDGRMPGFAAILGAAPDSKTAVQIVRELQKRNIICFVGSNHNGTSIIDQLKEENVQMGWETYIVPYGRDTITGIYPLNWAIRSALTFGGHKKGEALKCLKYCQNRVFAFGLALGELDDVKYATGAGAINMGFPVIADTDIPEIRPSGICTYEHLIKELDHKKLVPTSIQVRGVKVRVMEIPIPVAYSAAFEGETVRKEQMFVQFGGKYSTAFEYVTTRDLDEVEDGKIEVIGPEVDKAEEGGAMPLGIYVEVAGRKMLKDFEPILERQIHTFLNEAMGIFHMGQRDLNWLRISKDAKKKGFKIRHFGVIIHARLHDTFGAIVDKAQVTIYTRQEDVEKFISEAKKAYEERDERMAGMTDESVDTFYSCTLCQSFAPNHLCMVKPERLGLCGAYTWLDARACYELNPTGPNQPVKKGECLDPVRGEWKGVNDFIYQKSNKTLERFHGYSIMTCPETSCGCFECIIAILPETNGFMIVNREFAGMTPIGMTFSTLAGSVGGGAQTPGFMGIGRLYIVSRKFIFADGGIKRLVWMTKELKEALGDKFKKRCEEEGIPDLVDKIADETVATTTEELLSYLQKVKHPALEMEPLI
ncbi:MAG: acetyl-CoA decarbonylase/synthase complex subunit alpha/beta, partial [Elusimicrobiota bacterium]|nr:acetyl-CoA decarbonylase/synthase complex subunit alpha/beta [Elusimicrobiota bacterium]